jgi:DUF2075 family protein
MIIYQATKSDFGSDMMSNRIDEIIESTYYEKTGHRFQKNQMLAFRNSLSFMDRILVDPGIPGNCGVAIEYNIPQTSKRIDFILTGQTESGDRNAILIELKQWSEADATDMDGIVRTVIGGNKIETSHPSYQVWSYASLLRNFNESIEKWNINLLPCAYLHNFTDNGVLDLPQYDNYTSEAPIFYKDDAFKLLNFVKGAIKKGDEENIISIIEKGKIRPSKTLVDSLVKTIQTNDEFLLIDDQKVVFERVLHEVKNAGDTKKVFVVRGGPGTGKTVVAINLLVELIGSKFEKQAKYVSKNSAPREVYKAKLMGVRKRSQIDALFSGSGGFIDAQKNQYDVLLVDEAHRLNEKSGLYGNLGENQVKELITASKVSVFFVDEDQRVTFKDVGSEEEIRKWAKQQNADVIALDLKSQFRCNGSDGYIAWLDDVLQVRETANYFLDRSEYDFKIVDSPSKLRDLIFEKNKVANKARMVAGYCWNWVSKKNPDSFDIEFPEDNFGMKWNLASDGNLWVISEKSVNEIGCIHTCQGLEMDYVGVIIGPDLIVRGGRVITVPKARARTDKSLNGYGVIKKHSPELADAMADQIIKNTYRTLMTRGMKGCYIYSEDKETREYFQNRFGVISE